MIRKGENNFSPHPIRIASAFLSFVMFFVSLFPAGTVIAIPVVDISPKLPFLRKLNTNKDSSDNILSSYTYTLAPDGLRTGVVEKTFNPDTSSYITRTITYTYDALKRLTKEDSQSSDDTSLFYTDEYTYDLCGNRIKKIHSDNSNSETITYTYNENDQLTEETSTLHGTTEYTYDANGSLISKINTQTQESYQYTYNLQNRLATANISRIETDPATGLTKVVKITSSYTYNVNGIRVASNTSTVIDNGTPEVKNIKYLLDPSKVLSIINYYFEVKK